MTKKDAVLSILYRLIKYTKLISAISCLSLVAIVLFPIFYTIRDHVKPAEGLYIAFCVIWVLTYVTCIAIGAFFYIRHIQNMELILKNYLKTLTIITIVFPYFVSVFLYFRIKHLTEKVNNNVIVVEPQQPDIKHE
ncbi:hypothetical protein [Ureaplasma ceti]|uniref:Uncharacterized protein n=1 Tax=Ureaplasma ceti TaxID=3119530 RepID=A0ABP9U741_9BACT